MRVQQHGSEWQDSHNGVSLIETLPRYNFRPASPAWFQSILLRNYIASVSVKYLSKQSNVENMVIAFFVIYGVISTVSHLVGILSRLSRAVL